MRPDIDTTLMDIATVWGARSTCSRRNVGAIIAKNRRHIGSGYNGAPAGMPHCEHLPINYDLTPPIGPPPGVVPLVDKGCQVAIHAEANAIAYCARDGISVEGATMYVTLSPCWPCAQLIIAAGLSRVVYRHKYRNIEGIRLLQNAGVIVDWLLV